jgi:putative glutamine amidotransferase
MNNPGERLVKRIRQNYNPTPDNKMEHKMMKRSLPKILLILFFLMILSSSNFAYCQDRYFSSAEKENDRVVVAVLHPAKFIVESLLELKNQGLLNPENLVVVGVLHEKQMTDFEEAKKLKKEKGLDWIKFHTITGKIDAHSLFQQNEMTADFRTIYEKSDGIIFFGGADIPPYIYGEKTELLSAIKTPYRHFLEVSFIFHLFGGVQDKDFVGLMESRPKYPVLCICLGAQSLNVGTGGTLIQDIPSGVYGHHFIEDLIHTDKSNWHRNPYARIHPELGLYPYLLHPIKLLKNGKFTGDLGFDKADRPYVISAHHQALGKLGKGIKINATSSDGRVVEGIEHDRYPNVLGVQFHPDFPELWNEDLTFKWMPGDQEEVSFLTLMKKYPPSLEFNKKIWTWFFKQAKTNFAAK